MTPAAFPVWLSRHWDLFVVLPALLVLAVWWSYAKSFVVDDAFITFRYARHLASGLGPCYNPSDPPVEGYTSPLWMVMMAFGFLAGRNPEILSLILSAGSGIVVLIVVALWLRRIVGRTWIRCVALVWLGTNYTFLSWLSGGLETMTHTLTTTVAVFAFWHWLLRPSSRRGVAGGVLAGMTLLADMLMRPEGMMLAGLELIAMGWLALRRRHLFPSRQATAWFLVSAFVPFALFIAWRLHYYGNLLPNTFYVKGTTPSPRDGFMFVTVFLHSHLGTSWLVVILAGIFALSTRTLSSELRLTWLWLSALISAHLAYLIVLGGDVFEFRFLTQILPLFAIWTALGLDSLPRWPAKTVPVTATVLAVLLLVLNVMPMATFQYDFPAVGLNINSTQEWRTREDEWRAVGMWLVKYARKDESIAVLPAGIIPYLSDLRTLDLHGLNDPYTARLPGNNSHKPGHKKYAPMEYVNQWKPTYLLSGAGFEHSPFVNPGGLCVRVQPGRYLLFRTLDQTTASLTAKLLARGADVLSRTH